MSDLVNHPAHYEERAIKLEPIDFCERLPFCEGNALKYCFRAGHKVGASELQDLKKAQWYLARRGGFKMKDERFSELLDFLTRAEGLIGAAAAAALGDCQAFWCELEMQVGYRINELKGVN